jgi:hypothetical protein
MLSLESSAFLNYPRIANGPNQLWVAGLGYAAIAVGFASGATGGRDARDRADQGGQYAAALHRRALTDLGLPPVQFEEQHTRQLA